jgi:hypothetical protein
LWIKQQEQQGRAPARSTSNTNREDKETLVSIVKEMTESMSGAQIQSCKVDILEMDLVVNGDMGLVCTIQRVSVVLKTGDAKRLLVRETDCFERRNGEWKLILLIPVMWAGRRSEATLASVYSSEAAHVRSRQG